MRWQYYRFIKCLCVFYTCILLTGCGSKILWNNIFRYDRTFTGKVLDENSNKPIKDFVVITIWDRGTAGGSRYYDAAETVTNDQGEFKLPGQGFVFSMNERRVYLIKAGYESIDGYYYDMLAEQLPNYHVKEGKALFLMKKITAEELKTTQKSLSMPSPDVPPEKVKLMLKEIKKDDIERGLEPRGLFNSQRY